METSKIIKHAKTLNKVMIAITFILFAFFQIDSKILCADIDSMSMDELLRVAALELGVRGIVGVVSLAVVIFTIILMCNNHNRVKGLGLLLASAIVTIGFVILGIMAGIIVWILSGASLNQLKKNDAENDFEARIKNEMGAGQAVDPYNAQNSNQVQENTYDIQQ